MSKSIKFKNDLYLNAESIKNTFLVARDGIYDNLLIAEVNFNDTYQRFSLIFALTQTGYSDNTDSGIYNLGLASTSSVSNHQVSYGLLGNATTDKIYSVSDGSNLKIYIKKTERYRHLHATLIGKSEKVIWKLGS